MYTERPKWNFLKNTGNIATLPSCMVYSFVMFNFIVYFNNGIFSVLLLRSCDILSLYFFPRKKTAKTDSPKITLMQKLKKSKVQGPLLWKMAPPTARDIIAPIVVPVCMMANSIPFTGINLKKGKIPEINFKI